MDFMVTGQLPGKKMAEGFEGQRSCILPSGKRRSCASHPLCRKLYMTDIGYYPHASHHSRSRPKGCSQYILIYCVKGEGWYRLNNKEHLVRANQYFLLPADKPHAYGAAEGNPWSIYWVHFTGEQAEYFFRFLFTHKQAGPITVSPSPTRQFLFDDILLHLEFMNDSENLVYANCHLYAFLTSFKQVPIKAADKEHGSLQTVIAYMKENLDKQLSLKELAAAADMSASHLSALFRQKTKYSPINLFISFKMQKASQLLQESSHKVKAVAYQLGYDDPYHFSRVFRKVMGVSPKRFKETTP